MSMAPPYSAVLVDLITDILCPIVGTRQVWNGIPKLVSTFCSKYNFIPEKGHDLIICA